MGLYACGICKKWRADISNFSLGSDDELIAICPKCEKEEIENEFPVSLLKDASALESEIHAVSSFISGMLFAIDHPEEAVKTRLEEKTELLRILQEVQFRRV